MAGLLAAGLLVSAFTSSSLTVAKNAAETAGDVPRVIIDTDIALWWDDVTALAMANAAEDQGHLEILGVVADVKSIWAVPAIDAINTYYGNGKIPVGETLGTEQDVFPGVYTDELATQFPRSNQNAPDAVDLYRQLLSKEPDHSVTIVSLGGHTNLAALLASRQGNGSPLSGKDLVAQKVKLLVVMDGEFPVPSRAWTNTLIDPVATKYVFNGGWPNSVPIHWADAAIGFPLFAGNGVCDAHEDGPVRAAYDILFGCGQPVDDADWDGIAMYYAIYGTDNGTLGLTGAGGAARVAFFGSISWQPNPNRPDDRYMTVPSYPVLRDKIDALMNYVP